MKKQIKMEEAVSPVVGVMLMLVVTIIIAAVVSGFAGGLAGSQQKTPQASIVATSFVVNDAYDTDQGSANYVPNPVPGKAADIFIVFEHKGGDGIALGNMEIHLGSVKYQSQKSVISNLYTPNNDATKTGDKAGITSFSNNWTTYIEGYPDKESVISPGGKFVLHADWAKAYGTTKTIDWLPVEGQTAYTMNPGDYLTYNIVDKVSKKVISSGQILVPDFTVKTS